MYWSKVSIPHSLQFPRGWSEFDIRKRWTDFLVSSKLAILAIDTMKPVQTNYSVVE